MSGIPLVQFFLLTIAVFGICLGVSLLIASHLSEDKENSILRQLWDTFFGGSSNDSSNQP